jgi:hypothetical protein
VGTAEEAGFVLLRVALLIGEVLVQRLGGRWMLDEEPGSPHFASYVVGSFEGIRNRNAAVGPFVIARDYVVGVRGRAEGKGGEGYRTLEELVGAVEGALRGA